MLRVSEYFEWDGLKFTACVGFESMSSRLSSQTIMKIISSCGLQTCCVQSVKDLVVELR